MRSQAGVAPSLWVEPAGTLPALGGGLGAVSANEGSGGRPERTGAPEKETKA